MTKNIQANQTAVLESALVAAAKLQRRRVLIRVILVILELSAIALTAYAVVDFLAFVKIGDNDSLGNVTFIPPAALEKVFQDDTAAQLPHVPSVPHQDAAPAQSTEVPASTLSAEPPSPERADAGIRQGCATEWPEDFSMQKFCRDSQLEGLDALRSRRVERSVEQDDVEIGG